MWLCSYWPSLEGPGCPPNKTVISDLLIHLLNCQAASKRLEWHMEIASSAQSRNFKRHILSFRGFRPIQCTSIKQGGMTAPALELLVGHADSQMDFLTAVGEIHPAGGSLHLFLVVTVCHTEINGRQRWPSVAAAGSRRKPRLRAQPRSAPRWHNICEFMCGHKRTQRRGREEY